MKEWPILFSAPMARAVIEGRKSQTRRLDMRWAKAQPGEILRGRETWATHFEDDHVAPRALEPGFDATLIHYLADGPKPAWAAKTRVSIHMPSWVSRIVTPIVSVRVEKLWDITDDDAKAEGARFHDGGGVGHSGWRLDDKDVYPTPREAFFGLWARIHGAESLSANPSVVRVQFEPLRRTV